MDIWGEGTRDAKGMEENFPKKLLIRDSYKHPAAAVKRLSGADVKPNNQSIYRA